MRAVPSSISSVPGRARDSGTKTLLRLILPLSVMACTTFWTSSEVQSEELAETLESVGATGGVYKGQGRNQHELVTHAY